MFLEMEMLGLAQRRHTRIFQWQDNPASSYFSTFTTTATSTFAGGFSAASSLYALQNGNVGIGTAAPSRKFHVSGGSALIENAGAVQLTLYDSSNSQIPNITFNQSSQKAFIQGVLVLTHASIWERGRVRLL